MVFNCSLYIIGLSMYAFGTKPFILRLLTRSIPGLDLAVMSILDMPESS